MKRISLIICFLTVMVSCSVRKKPIFIGIEDVKLISFAPDTTKLEAKALFKNENDIGGKILTNGIDVLIDQKPIAIIKSEEFDVPANKNFEIPLIIAVPNNKLFGQGFLGGLLNTFIKSKTIKINFKGAIKYKVFGFSSTYPLNKTKEFKLNQ